MPSKGVSQDKPKYPIPWIATYFITGLVLIVGVTTVDGLCPAMVAGQRTPLGHFPDQDKRSLVEIRCVRMHPSLTWAYRKTAQMIVRGTKVIFLKLFLYGDSPILRMRPFPSLNR